LPKTPSSLACQQSMSWTPEPRQPSSRASTGAVRALGTRATSAAPHASTCAAGGPQVCLTPITCVHRSHLTDMLRCELYPCRYVDQELAMTVAIEERKVQLMRQAKVRSYIGCVLEGEMHLVLWSCAVLRALLASLALQALNVRLAQTFFSPLHPHHSPHHHHMGPSVVFTVGSSGSPCRSC
jgi:hypothetical protein